MQTRLSSQSNYASQSSLRSHTIRPIQASQSGIPVAIAILVSQPIRPSRAGNTFQETQTSLSRQPSEYSHSRHTIPPCRSSQSRNPFRYSYQREPTKPNQSMVKDRAAWR